MKIRFYGSSASEGVPALFCECEFCNKFRKIRGKNLRTRTCVQIDDNLLIDCSIDLYAQTLFRGLDMREITTMLITHSHQDHFLPISLAHIKPPMAFYSRNRHLDLYGNKMVTSQIDLLSASPHPASLYDYLTPHTIAPMDQFTFDSYTVKALPANHDPKEDCLLYIIHSEGKTLLFGHDSGPFYESVWDILRTYNFDCVVLDCTMVERTGVFSNHMGLPDNVAVRERMLREGCASPQTIFIATHFVHTFDPDHERITPIFAEKGFIAAYDGLCIEF